MASLAERRAIRFAAGCVGFFAGWFLSVALPLPLPWYHPLERLFTFEVRPTTLAIDYFARVALALLVGALGAVLGELAQRRTTEAGRVKLLRVLMVWTVALLVFCSGLLVFQLATRQPVPEPLPVDYVPR